MGFDKTLHDLSGTPLLARTIKRLSDVEEIVAILVAVQPRRADDVRDIVKQFELAKVTRVVMGGETRTHSVWNALQAVEGNPDVIAVHDGARPFVSVEAVRASLYTARDSGGAVVATPVIPTIKQVKANLEIERTFERGSLWAAATPQSFRYKDFLQAYQAFWKSGDDPATLTDDAQILERAGGVVKIVEGNIENIKLTTPLDWKIAEILLDTLA